MKITYDPTVDALYIQFKETTVTTQQLSEGIALDYDADGYLAGIEILDTTVRLNAPQTFRQIVLENIGVAIPETVETPIEGIH
ncbi:MAG: DUF2283 domain-containing protein [Chloroflexaceae bacterium]|nr:DUF2283 domain-containing protein [Chloroflexaceae bacterium]